MSSYDFPYLTDGLKLVIVGLGIFAIPEIISLLRQDRAISKEPNLGGGWLDGVQGLVRQYLAVGALLDHRRDRRRDPRAGRLGRRLDRLWPHGADHQGQVELRQGRECAA